MARIKYSFYYNKTISLGQIKYFFDSEIKGQLKNLFQVMIS